MKRMYSQKYERYHFPRQLSIDTIAIIIVIAICALLIVSAIASKSNMNFLMVNTKNELPKGNVIREIVLKNSKGKTNIYKVSYNFSSTATNTIYIETESVATCTTLDTSAETSSYTTETTAQTTTKCSETTTFYQTKTTNETITTTEKKSTTVVTSSTTASTTTITETEVTKSEAEFSEDVLEEWTGPVLNKKAGTIIGPSGKETYYNLDMSGVLRNMRALGYDYEYSVRDDGVKMFGPYVMCAANLEIRPKGTIIQTSLGMGIVCDTGGFAKSNKTQIDIAVNW